MPNRNRRRSTQEHRDEIAGRLSTLRRAVGRRLRLDHDLGKSEFVALVNGSLPEDEEPLNPKAYFHAENGLQRLNVDDVMRLLCPLGVTLDWIYRGNIVGCNPALARYIKAIEAEDNAAGEQGADPGERPSGGATRARAALAA